MVNRRKLVNLYLLGGTAALVAASCTPQQVTDVEKQVSDIIQKVQAGVVQACAAAGKLVPTANTVFQVLASILGSANVALATAEMIAQAVTAIVAVGCPATTAPTATPRKTEKGVDVVFY
jgi:hypothetical protein